MSERKVVIPGEVIFSGDDYLPGDGTSKKGSDIVSLKFGLAEEMNKLVKVIPLSGVYQPRRGNVIVGKVIMLTHNGWVIDIGTAENAFLPLTETSRYVHKDRLDEVLDLGDMVVAKIWGINGRGIDLSIKSRGLGKIAEGIIFEVNPNKIPRIIGKEGSMIKMIRDYTDCNITAGQNGFIWVKGDKIEDELLAKESIGFIVENSFIDGLTDSVENWFKEKGAVKREKPEQEFKKDVQEEVNREVEALENNSEDLE